MRKRWIYYFHIGSSSSYRNIEAVSARVDEADDFFTGVNRPVVLHMSNVLVRAVVIRFANRYYLMSGHRALSS